ncbi:peptidylprolyl isomerase [Gracilimonas mengyeensis]|uniref:peptidylprolyl isomerase n=1 Tax=Gracilimonas mengyeensis TaxID=1302730 RepID=A0A521FFP0_9BACT|nr:peptidylprolyl isomerase [Gracilimonas mengyeensis]SMO94794.1 Peptidyl-prolyl cis-trans isomerase (rotamase)-cyclophilin family [Gracilimonas mengyeensis]
MKFNRKCVKNMCGFLGMGILMLTFTSCKKESAYSRLLTEDYPELYTHVFSRDADSLLSYVDSPDEFIREQAWRALISTPVEDVDAFLTQVQYSNTTEGWMALSMKDLNDGQLQRLHTLWDQRVAMRPGISTVLGRQGNQESLDMLVSNFDNIIDEAHEFESALAISRLSMEYEIPALSQNSILKYAAITDEEELFQAYFYGLYRSGEAIESQELLKNVWDSYDWSRNPRIQQYVLRIAMNSDAAWTFDRLNIEGVDTMDVRLAVELAQLTSKLDWSEKLANTYTLLMQHDNPVVNITALEQIRNHPEKPDAFDEIIVSEILENQEKEATVQLSGLLAMSDAGEHLQVADELADGNVYLLPKKLGVYANETSGDEFLAMLSEYAESDDRMEAVAAINVLANRWNQDENAADNREEVREVLTSLLERGDRSITYLVVQVWNDEELIEAEDFERIEELMSGYSLPADVEVYQAFGQLLHDHFEEEAGSLIDDWAEQGNPALNSTLNQQGWDVPVAENRPEFREPDWARLGELGYEPTWALAMEEDTIRIKMDVLSAPATISGIDSLTRADAYDNVAFHRVVPNFVVQGGDVETGDGFGGPDFVVPTEASTKQYRRGVVGIASAGTDTEGSQYFIMHDWAPHLNGRYTVIGEVTEGMEAVDRIVVGDKVLDAWWEITEE